MEVQFWATTDTGRVRDHNEDNFLVDSDLNLFVVCDGMGGHAGGEVASAISVRTIHEVVSSRREVIENLEREPSNPSHRDTLLGLLERAITEASNRVYAAAQHDSTRKGMGTTCSALIVCGGRGFVGHVGDSRIYRVRSGRVEQLTDDHSLLNEMIRQGRAKAGDSIPNQNAVTRAVGVRDSVEVDVDEIEILDGDRFLLCSDGLSGYLESDGQILDLLDGEDLEVIAEACIDHALDSGGKDNITAILVDASSTGAAKQTRLDSRVVEMIASSPIFEHVTPSELASLAEVAERHGFEAGATIIDKGMSAESLCLIVKGSVGVLGPEANVTVLETGSFFGAMSLVGGAPPDEACEALEPTNLLVFRRQPLFALLRERPELSSKVLYGLASTFARQLRRVPADLRNEPRRWDEVSIQGEDETPAPGSLVVKPRRSKAAAEGEGDASSSSPASKDHVSEEDETQVHVKLSDVDMDEVDLEDLRSTIKLDLDDESIEEL
ncbi:cyclic nucleotide-binding domain-containing protein [Persicimonas caeni]|uniref:Cyclic nucleotide-binding domain-containing protein n=1 Tax=Persicimonas caeni TaxID=2292766 RepID=A0A4Y6Q1L9_PERCE|nr:protein phosphatase 2C domain-containing protein [Persicimonas caeni]QDG54330.1 cyclic nucleotide-binding domain-containing protein [Persicimonas caeni]QED35551.1 cyclic nucleotide-binding domain-containing protein [Persicimonas caeni]